MKTIESIKIVAAADVHLGRSVITDKLTTATTYPLLAWQRLVDYCLDDDNEIDLLLLAGDLLDSKELFIETYTPLHRSLYRLGQKGIVTVAVAGNHDAGLLQTLASKQQLPHFHLLGAEGKWQRVTLQIKNRTVHIDGLSFKEPYLTHNPFDDYRLPPLDKEDEKGVHIGLLHCDVDSPQSPYAPVRLSDFINLGHHVWVLGHIHIPKILHQKEPFVFYCGSLQGLDISEKGQHGAFCLGITPQVSISDSMVSFAPLRWESVEIDLSQITVDHHWKLKVIELIEKALKEKIKQESDSDIIGVRATLTGATELYRELRQDPFFLQNTEELGFALHKRWLPYFIESCHNKTAPPLDLGLIAQGSDLTAALASFLLNDSKKKELLASFKQQIEEELAQEPYLKQCSQSWPREERIDSLCEELILALLDTLIADKNATVTALSEG